MVSPKPLPIMTTVMANAATNGMAGSGPGAVPLAPPSHAPDRPAHPLGGSNGALGTAFGRGATTAVPGATAIFNPGGKFSLPKPGPSAALQQQQGALAPKQQQGVSLPKPGPSAALKQQQDALVLKQQQDAALFKQQQLKQQQQQLKQEQQQQQLKQQQLKQLQQQQG